MSIIESKENENVENQVIEIENRINVLRKENEIREKLLGEVKEIKLKPTDECIQEFINEIKNNNDIQKELLEIEKCFKKMRETCPRIEGKIRAIDTIKVIIKQDIDILDRQAIHKLDAGFSEIRSGLLNKFAEVQEVTKYDFNKMFAWYRYDISDIGKALRRM